MKIERNAFNVPIVFNYRFCNHGNRIFAISSAHADDNSCWLEATNSEIYLTVWDLDNEGNELAKIWEGLLAPGNKEKLITSNGKIRYYPNIDAPSSSAGVDKICQNAETISLP